MRASVIGAGSWGTAKTARPALLDHEVKVWAREAEVVEGINMSGGKPVFLKDIALPPGIEPAATFRRRHKPPGTH